MNISGKSTYTRTSKTVQKCKKIVQMQIVLNNSIAQHIGILNTVILKIDTNFVILNSVPRI